MSVHKRISRDSKGEETREGGKRQRTMKID